MFKNIALHGAYISSKQLRVNKMKSPYDIKFLAIIQVIYERDNICYFKNKNVTSFRKAFVGSNGLGWNYVQKFVPRTW